MADLIKLVDGLKDHADDPQSYFLSFFDRQNLKDYVIDEEADKDARKAITVLFTSKKELRERCELSFSYDPLCVEAFFIYFILNEDIFVYKRFESYYEHVNEYGDLSSYRKNCYLRILNFYVEFLLDISNISKAIKVEKMILRLKNEYTRSDINTLSFMYSVIEEDKDFYRLYLDYEFDAYDYILLIVTLLKHDERLKAIEVSKEMLEKIPYASYLDHMWDLDENDPEEKKFAEMVEELYESISAVPDFFSFMNEVREAHEGTI